jgi:hypothetical protein
MKAGLVRQVSISKVIPAPINLDIYRQPGAEDGLDVLVESIKKNGIMTPLTVSEDLRIISGHRRREAAIQAQVTKIPCIVRKGIRYPSDQFTKLLVEANTQREKTLAEIAAEHVVLKSSEEAAAALYSARAKKLDDVWMEPLDAYENGSANRRRFISEAKVPMAQAVVESLADLKNYLPVTLRQLHYRLLNNPPLRHSKKPDSVYRNDRQSYQDLSDLVTRLRVFGLIKRSDMVDHTRETHRTPCRRSAGAYIKRQQEYLLKSYWRDLMQSQPLHIEIIAEKNTVLSTLKPIADQFTVPLTILRGYPSFSMVAEIYDRMVAAKREGKKETRLIAVTDHDPEGEDICRAVERILCRDFSAAAASIHTIKAALTMEQIDKHNLPANQTVKTTSSRAKGYVDNHGRHTWELEALHPKELQQLVYTAIESSLDVEAFNAELEKEEEEAVELDAMRQRMLAAMGAGR